MGGTLSFRHEAKLRLCHLRRCRCLRRRTGCRLRSSQDLGNEQCWETVRRYSRSWTETKRRMIYPLAPLELLSVCCCIVGSGFSRHFGVQLSQSLSYDVIMQWMFCRVGSPLTT